LSLSTTVLLSWYLLFPVQYDLNSVLPVLRLSLEHFLGHHPLFLYCSSRSSCNSCSVVVVFVRVQTVSGFLLAALSMDHFPTPSSVAPPSQETPSSPSAVYVLEPRVACLENVDCASDDMSRSRQPPPPASIPILQIAKPKRRLFEAASTGDEGASAASFLGLQYSTVNSKLVQ
jgi:hypothetical protein